MDARDLGGGHREEAERVLLAEVALPDEREPDEVVERFDGHPAEPLALEGDALHREAERLLQPPELEARARPALHRLGFAVPDHARCCRRGGSGKCSSTAR